MVKTHSLIKPQTRVAKRSSSAISAKPLDRLGILFIILSAVGFGTLGIFGKLAYAQGFTVLSTVSWRVTGGAIALWTWLLLNKRWRITRQATANALMLGAVGYTIPTAFFFSALTYTGAGVTALMFYTYPAFVAFWHWVMSRKPLHRFHVMALGLALLGCLSTVDWSQEKIHPLGIALGITAGCSYGIYMILSARIVHQAPPIQMAGYMLLGASVVSLGIAHIQHKLILPTTWEQLAIVLGLAILATALPLVLLYGGLKRLEVVPASILSTLEPVVAIFMGFCLFGEPLWLGQLIGAVLILASAILLQTRLKP